MPKIETRTANPDEHIYKSKLTHPLAHNHTNVLPYIWNWKKYQKTPLFYPDRKYKTILLSSYYHKNFDWVDFL